MITFLQSRPIRTVIKWQLIATVGATAIAGAWAGGHAALSACLGGLVNVTAGVAYALLLGLALGAGYSASAGFSLVAMFRAEAVKIVLIVGQLWLVLSVYKEIVPVAFFTVFVVTVVVFSLAFFVRD